MLEKPQKFQLPVIAWIYIGGIAALLLSYLLFAEVRQFAAQGYEMLLSNDRSAIQNWVAGFGFWGPVLIVAMMIAQTLVSAVPMILVLIVAVLAYGPLWGGLLGWAGAIVAAILGYGIARVFGDVLQDKFVTPKIRDIIAQNVSQYGAWAILALRLSPLVPSDGVSFVAGLVRMSFLPFLGGTVGGVTPIALAVAYFGSDFERLGTLIVGITVVSLTALVGYIAYDKFGKPKHKTQS
ncbi:MAG: TVP38/TMEM64 family protein [Deinococcales bacterium]